jgi:CRISPR-associated protein Csb3
MSQKREDPIRIRVDPTNPGQFFACCGLLELADRLWDGAEGWFDDYGTNFCIRSTQTIQDSSAADLIGRFARCHLTNTMTDSQLQRRNKLSAMPKKQREAAPSLEVEKKSLDALWREAPIQLHEPFNLRLDWFIDERAGGGTFKTWAGQQSVLEIARGMKAPIDAGEWDKTPTDEWLFQSTSIDALPFNFDSDLGSTGSDRDVGFSFDPLKSIRVRTRPLIELIAFIGLQRFRPINIAKNRYQFSLWSDPLTPEVATTAACGVFKSPRSRTFEFQLLYRTKYLKSFLPAHPVEENKHE